MTQISALLELRNKIKEKKPIFIRQDNPKRRKLNYKWRKPKGIHSKIRHRFKGRRKMPSPGYKSPRKVKGLHSSGLKIVNTESIDNLKEIKKENEGIVVAKNVGMKKRLEIFKKAKELDARILNLNVDEQIKKIEDMINSKKKVIKEAKKEDSKKEIKEKKTKETKEESEKPTGENKKELNASERDERELASVSRKQLTRSQLTEKKEKDKLLTKKV